MYFFYRRVQIGELPSVPQQSKIDKALICASGLPDGRISRDGDRKREKRHSLGL